MIRICMKVFSFVLVAAVITSISGFSYLYLRKPAAAQPSAVKIEITPARLARGKYLFTLADCGGCHSQRDFSRFGGPEVKHAVGRGNVFPPELGLPGLVAARNITPGYQAFRHMSDEDVYSLVAYLNTLTPVRNRVPRSQIAFPVSLFIKSAPRPVGHVPEPDRSNKVTSPARWW